MDFDVIKCGARVTPKLSNIEGIITCISIRFEKISYEVTYFYNGDFKVVWCHEDEFEVGKGGDKQKIGFNK